MTTWNEIPFNSGAEPEVKADEFDRQYAENQQSGNAKEEAGSYRPEPGSK